MQRRTFLVRGATVATLASAFPALAIEPFKRPVPGRLRLSLAAYSMRKYLAPNQAATRKMDLFDFVNYCRDQGLDGAELTSYYFPEDVDDAYLFRLRRHCHLAGITITGGAIRNDFCSPDPAKIAADMEHTKLWIDRYAAIGAPAIRIFAGQPNKEEPLEKTLQRCAQNCEIACEYAQSKGIVLALENHGGVTTEAEGLLSIVRQVNSDAFGVNFDSGNFHSADPYAELERIAPYAVNAQIKVEIHAGERKEPADLARIVGILRDAGYSGWVALEYEAAEEPWDAIPNWLDQLKTLVA